ncbi:MAG: dihydropteroate synthase [Deltaproteobacteria bacterium]|nr:dihydropteroate synthase [Deltaproteobacteria bacterium]
MIIIGERINTSRKPMAKAVDERDVAFIQADVKKQEEAGASFIDVNCGTRLKTELDDFLWLMDVIQDVVSIPLCLDSPDPKVLAVGLTRAKKRPMINSITLEPDRFEAVGPLVANDAADVVALCMDETGIPRTTAKVFENAQKLVAKLEALGVKRGSIYLDPMIQPVSTDTDMGLVALTSIETIMTQLPGVHTTCGLSNVSFGLPERFLVNRHFLTCAMAKGLDSAIIDPLDRKIMTSIFTTEMVLGRDEYCANYIDAVREGRIEP